MNVFRVTFSDGNTVTTSMNATFEQAEDYYFNNWFNFGCEEDYRVWVTKVEQIK